MTIAKLPKAATFVCLVCLSFVLLALAGCLNRQLPATSTGKIEPVRIAKAALGPADPASGKTEYAIMPHGDGWVVVVRYYTETPHGRAYTTAATAVYISESGRVTEIAGGA